MSKTKALSVRVSTLVHATEDREKVANAVLGLCVEGFPKKVETAKFKGHYGNEIVIVRMKASGGSKADQFLANLWSRFSPADRMEILSGLENRIDSSGALHIRVGKEECFEGRLVLKDADPVKVEVHFGVSGLSREAILERVRRKLTDLSALGPNRLVSAYSFN